MTNALTAMLGDAANDEVLVLRLVGIIFWSLTLCVCVSIVAVVLVMRDTKDWFVPSTGPGFLRAGVLSDSFLWEEASTIARQRHNWTAETLPHAQAEFRARLVPPKRKAYETKVMPEELRLIKEHKIGWQQFVVTHVDVLARKAQATRVLVHGIRSLWIGSTVSDEAITVDMVLEPLLIQGRPHGVQVADFQDTHPLKVSKR